MSKPTKYPLIEKLGLETYQPPPSVSGEGMGKSYAYFGVSVSADDLEAYLQSCPVVYGSPENHLWTEGKFAPGVYTHSARLVQIEELAKPECKHEPDFMHGKTGYAGLICKHCGVELIAEWKAK